MKKYFLLFSSLLILGIGCNEPAPKVALGDPEQIVQKQPDKSDPMELVYTFCEKNGNNIVVQFDEQSKTSRPFCLFSNNTQCDAVAYMNGECSPQNGAKIFANAGNDITALLRSCGSEDPVVCGADGRNYTNRCVAELQHIVAKHTGVCTAEEQAETLVPSDPVTSTPGTVPGSTSPSQSTSPNIKAETPDWLPILYQITLTSGKETPRASVEKCDADGTVVYHYQEGGKRPFTVLYNDSGTVQCFPQNDMTAACPTFIKENKREQYCKEIWRDPR